MASESTESNNSSQKNHVKRVRATNFNVNETLLLEEMVKENFEILNSKLTNQVTNSRKSEIWRDISTKISAFGYAHRTEQACIEKWANLKRKAKEDLTKEKLERRKTGGGPSVSVSQQSQRIGDLLANSSAFSGIDGGLDTDEQDGLHYLSNNKGCDLQPNAKTPASVESPPAETVSSMEVQTGKRDTVYTEDNSTSASGSNVILGSKRPSHSKLAVHKQVKKSKSEILTDYQIAYFKGMVERQGLEKELLEVKLRIMKAAEAKLAEVNAAELLHLLSEQ